MRKFITVLTVVALLSFPVVGLAKGKGKVGKLPAPTNVVCSVAGDNLTASWDAVEGARKYSVDVIVGYDLDGDTVVDFTADYDFSANATNTDVPLASLVYLHDVDGDGVVDAAFAPSAIDVRVKGLNPGKGAGRQNNAFSAPCRALGQ